MSADLVDLRTKITLETDAMLEQEARLTGKKREQVAREFLHDIAVRRLHAANLLVSLARAKGVPGGSQGGPGQ